MGGTGSDARAWEVAGLTDAELARASAIVGRLQSAYAEQARVAAVISGLLADAETLARDAMDRQPERAREREMIRRCIAAELGAATRVNDRTIQARMDGAHRLRTHFPATLTALADGRISPGHADVIVETGTAFENPEARAAFEGIVLSKAETQTPARTRAFARQLAERLNPTSMSDRHAAAVDDRSVSVREIDDAMSELILRAPTVLVRGIHSRLTEQAKQLRAIAREHAAEQATGDQETGDEKTGDTRTIDQIRADLAADMLLTGAPAIDPTRDRTPGGLGAIRAHVEITIPLPTLTGTAHSGAQIDGHTPIDPESARRLAGESTGWDRVLLHPVTGIVHTVDRYRPSEQLRRTLHARDRHCRFPGCRMPARRCDIDHTRDHARGGRTELCNLCCLCKRHHTLKHATDWTVRQLPGGTLEWTSPTGRVYDDTPPPHIIFTPDPEPPPF